MFAACHTARFTFSPSSVWSPEANDLWSGPLRVSQDSETCAEVTPGLSAGGDWAGWVAGEEMRLGRRTARLLRLREHHD